MKTKKVFLTILFSCLTLLGAFFQINIDENYMNNIVVATQMTPNKRSVIQFQQTNFDENDFSRYREGVNQLTNGYGNAFRVVDKNKFDMKFGDINIDSSFDLIDYDGFSGNNTSLLFVSHGKIPTSEEHDQIVIEYSLSLKILNMGGFTDVSDVIGQTINFNFSNGGTNYSAGGQDFVIGGVYYASNEKNYLSYANTFYEDSFESPIFIQSKTLDSLNIMDSISYYSTFVHKDGLDYIERSFKLSLRLVEGNLMDISFPSVISNTTPSSCQINLSTLQYDLNKITRSAGSIAISTLATIGSMVLFYFIVREDVINALKLRGLHGFSHWSMFIIFPLVSIAVVAILNLLFSGNIVLYGLCFYPINQSTLVRFLLSFILYIIIVSILSRKESEFNLE